MPVVLQGALRPAWWYENTQPRGRLMRAFNILGAIVLIAATLAGCKRQTVADVAPPQATDVAPTPKQTSLIAVPIDADAAMLKSALERAVPRTRSEEHTAELPSLKRNQYDVFCLKQTHDIQ